MPEQFLPTDECAKCGGQCCTNYPGAYWPQDVPGGTSAESIAEFVWSKRACFDWWEGDPRPGYEDMDDECNYVHEDRMSHAYFLRPRTVNGFDKNFDPTWGGQCWHLTNNGCELAREDMPTGCMALEPIAGGKCVAHCGAKEGAVLAWLEYREEIEQAAKIVRGY